MAVSCCTPSVDATTPAPVCPAGRSAEGSRLPPCLPCCGCTAGCTTVLCVCSAASMYRPSRPTGPAIHAGICSAPRMVCSYAVSRTASQGCYIAECQPISVGKVHGQTFRCLLTPRQSVQYATPKATPLRAVQTALCGDMNSSCRDAARGNTCIASERSAVVGRVGKPY